MRPATFSCLRRPAFAVAADPTSSARGIGCIRQDVVARAFEVTRGAGILADETAAPSHEMLKEKRLVKRALNDLNVNRLVSRQGSIIGISFCLSTARGKKFHRRYICVKFPAFRPKLPSPVSGVY
jgi:hypothetical protein